VDDESRLIDAALREIDAIPQVAAPVESIDGYQLLSEIHRGAQGVVYRAVQESTGQHVAIKVMREGPHAGEVNRARFEREIQILAQLQHPNIVSILDTGSSAGSFFFVMDYINGQPLDVYIAGDTRSIAETLDLFVKICGAIHAAHVRGVIHRDIKPGNILIDERGEPHVLDFGLAKVEEEDDSTMMTMTGQFVGSIPWSSPEQADSPSLVDVRSDVYALGVILFQMLTGKFPYDVTGNLREVLDRICNASPASPRALRREIDDELETILFMCLAKDADRRYQTSGELARDVESYLAGDPIQAKRDSTWYLLCKQFKRHRLAMGVAAAFVLVVTAGFIVSFTYWQKAERNRQIAEKALSGAERLNTFFEELFESAPFPVDTAHFIAQGQVPRAPQPPTLVDLLDRARHDVEVEFADAPQIEAKARNTIGTSLMKLARFEEARDEFALALDLNRAEFGESHPETLETAGLLANSFVYSGDATKAEEVLRPLVVRMEKVLGEDEAPTLRARSALGYVVATQGRVEEGKQILLSVKSHLDHKLDEQLNLPHELQEMEIVELCLEPAMWLGEAGELEAAGELARRSHEVSMRVRGPSHWFSIEADRTRSRVSRLRDGGTFAIERTFSAGTGVRGQLLITGTRSDHEAVQVEEWDQARQLWNGGERAQAASAARRAVEKLELSLGPTHTQTLAAKGRLAWELRGVPDALEEAELLARETLELNRELHGDDHLDSLLSEQTLGVILHLRGRTVEADELLSDLLPRAMVSVPEDGGRLWLFHWTHAAALREVEREGYAHEVLWAGCKGLVRTFGPQNDKTRRALQELAALSERLGSDDGLEWSQEMLSPRPRDSGQGAPDGEG
jgi:tRNA A-37 threonylcarbamoyl transferase component Bud32/tetratricopeptide (TPR) repeat protein